MRVAICIVTYQRPDGLARLLQSLDRLTFTEVRPPELEVVVVDNAPDASAAGVCEQARPALRWPLRYAHEPERGIAQARNRAVAASADTADFIAFIDDDEVPEPQWLDALLAVQARHAADAVAGPVLPRFLEPAPDWIVRGGFFERRRHATGTTLPHAGTCNVLIRTVLFRQMGVPFDPRFGLTGGEDTLFFLRAVRAGCRLVWADEAVVHEWHPASRVTATWLLRRAFRLGNTASRCERELSPSPARRAVRVIRALGRMTQGTVSLPMAVVLGQRALAIRSLQHVCRGAGALSGAAGFRYQEYRRPHGR